VERLKIGTGSMTTDIKSALTQVFTHAGRGDGRCPRPSASLPSSYELHRRAQRERNLVINALLRSAMRQFVKWLSTLARGGVKRARELMDELRRRRDIRALMRFDNRALADIGVGRSEIESVVRNGRCLSNEPQRPMIRRTSREAAVRAHTSSDLLPHPCCFTG